MSVSTLKNFNKSYLGYLAAYPLLTKSVTSGFFLGLNEIIASVVTSEYQQSVVLGTKVNHVLSPKLVTMIFYGSVISTPISHNMYKVINKIFAPPLSPALKLLQVLTSLGTVTPTLAAIYTAWVSILNGYRPTGSSFGDDVALLIKVVKTGLNNSYGLILKSSLATSALSLVIAQKYIQPELWVVFFNFCFFITGTLQNIKMKNAQKLARAKAQKDKDEKKD